jgi:NADPH:quinone reductase
VVGYGNTTSLRGEGLGSDRKGVAIGFMEYPCTRCTSPAGGFSPARKRIIPYSIQTLKRLKPALFRHDLMALLELHYQHRIKPLIAHRFPLADARRAQELLAKGGVVGKIVLLRDAPSAAA